MKNIDNEKKTNQLKELTHHLFLLEKLIHGSELITNTLKSRKSNLENIFTSCKNLEFLDENYIHSMLPKKTFSEKHPDLKYDYYSYLKNEIHNVLNEVEKLL